MTDSIIELDDVSKSYRIYFEKNQDLKRRILRRRRARFDEFWAVKNVSFSIERGEVFGIVGSNGSGKSTTLKLLAKILEPDGGDVHVRGTLSALLELGAGFHPDLSGRENIFLNGALLGLSRRQLNAQLDDIIEFAGLAKFIDNPVKTYSSGMYARLGFSVAINVDPEILLIDEVLAVGDDEFQRRCLEKIGDMRSNGRTIVLVSHSLGLVQTMCDRVAWIDKGALRSIGPSHDVVDEYQSMAHADAVMIDGHVHTGTGEVRISDVSLTSADILGIATGAGAQLNFLVESQLSNVEVSIGFSIRRTDGVQVCGDDSRRATSMTLSAGPSTVAYTIPRMPLIVGQYDVEIVVMASDNDRVLDQNSRALRFTVTHGHEIGQAGVVSLFGTWQLGGRTSPR